MTDEEFKEGIKFMINYLAEIGFLPAMAYRYHLISKKEKDTKDHSLVVGEANEP